MGEFSLVKRLAHRAGFLPVAILLALTPGSLMAKLGDTPRECLKRYGPPTGHTEVPGLIPSGVMFQRGEYSITCGFENEICTVVVVLRNVPENPAIRTIPREDISLFMHENIGHMSWEFTRFSPIEKFWRTRDWKGKTSYEATFAPSLQMLTLRLNP